MPPCKEDAIGQDDLRTGSWTTRLRLQLHLLVCRHCRRYAAQIRALGEAARTVFREQGEDAQALDRIRERVRRDAKTNAGSQTHRQ